jgi:hypothetical protein
LCHEHRGDERKGGEWGHVGTGKRRSGPRDWAYRLSEGKLLGLSGGANGSLENFERRIPT